MDFTYRVGEVGEEYNEKTKVDPNKRTELFHVRAHPGVDRSDTLHDFKQVRFSSLRSPLIFKTIYYVYTLSFYENCFIGISRLQFAKIHRTFETPEMPFAVATNIKKTTVYFQPKIGRKMRIFSRGQNGRFF